MGRDKGKGKAGRGGGRRMFIENAEELEIRNREIGEQQKARAKRRGDEEDSGSEEGSEDEDDEQEEGGVSSRHVSSCSKRFTQVHVHVANEQKGPADVFAFARKSKNSNAAATDEEGETNGVKAPSAMKTHNPNQNKPAEKMIKVKNVNEVTAPADVEAGFTRKQK